MGHENGGWMNSELRTGYTDATTDSDNLPCYAPRGERINSSRPSSRTFDLRVDGQLCAVNITETELRSYGWVGGLDETLHRFREDFKGHVSRVDSATKLTQTQEDSQLKRAKEVLIKFEQFYSALSAYGFADVKRQNGGRMNSDQKDAVQDAANVMTPVERPALNFSVNDPTMIKIHIESCISSLRDEDGRTKTRELSLAVTKLQEATMWIDEHLRLS